MHRGGRALPCPHISPHGPQERGLDDIGEASEGAARWAEGAADKVVRLQDVNRAGFLLKLDYDWIHIKDLGVKDPELFAITGRNVQVA